jgi:DNA-binding transcriptional LysR family regulator
LTAADAIDEHRSMTFDADRARLTHRLDAQMLSDLWVFRAAASSGSITGAATRLNVTQSAVSQRVLRLEARLGTPLFVRHKSRIVLTDAGTSLLQAMSQVTMLLNDALSRVNPLQHEALVVSCTPSLATDWLVPNLEAFYRLHPGIEVFVRAELGSATINRLDDEGIDVLIDYATPPADLQELASVQEYVFPVCSRSMREQLDGPDAATMPLVLLHDDVNEAEWGLWRKANGSDWPGRAVGNRLFNLAHLAYQAAMTHQGVAIGRSVIVNRLLSLGALVVAVDASPAPAGIYRLSTNRPGGDGSPVRKFAQWWRESMMQTQAQTLSLLAAPGAAS